MHVRDRRLWPVALTAAAALVVGTVGTAAPAAAVDGSSYFQIDSDKDDYALGGEDVSVSTPSAAFSWTAATASTVKGYVQGPLGGIWRFELAAPAGQEFTAGTTYANVAIPAVATAGQAGLEIGGSQCGSVRGSITIHELEKDPVSGSLTRLAASFVQFCGPLTAGLRGSIGYNATKLTPLLTPTTPATAAPNGPLIVSGKVVDLNGPVVGAAVEVSRPDGSGGTFTLPATTDATGAFSVNDTIGTTARTYTVTAAGDVTRFSVARTITVTAVQLKTALALTVPTTTVSRGTTYAVKGSLKGGGVAIPGVTVTLKRTDLAGTRTVYVKTTSSGAFIHKDTPAVGGKVTWTASWPGSARYTKPVPPVRSVTVSRLATRLTIASDKTIYPYGATAAVTVHLGPTWNGRTVSVYSKAYFASSARLITTAKVSSTGNLVVRIPLRMKTVITATFAGDYRYAPVSAKRTVTVRAKVAVTLTGAYGRSGSTYLFRIGENPMGQAAIIPFQTVTCSKLIVQRLRGSTWETTSSGICAWTNDKSVAAFQIFTDSTWRKGRVMLVVPNDFASTGVSTPWTYFSFT